MQPNDISPFIKATKSVFDTMLRLPVSFGKPTLGQSNIPKDWHVTGIIGLSGDLVGAVAVMFPRLTAKACVEALAGMEVDFESEMFADAIGELANMISGAAKAQYDGKDISISCPSVIVGSSNTFHSHSNTHTVCIPCDADGSSFCIVVSLQNVVASESKVAA